VSDYLEAMTPANLQQWWLVSQFLHHEADLLDNREFDQWLALLDESVRYRMPIARNVRRGQGGDEYTAPGEVAWFDEGIATLRQRIAQLKTGLHWAEEPGSRVSHLVTNIRIVGIEPLDGGAEAVRVRSRFLVSQNRLQTENNLFVGKREDVLRVSASDIRLLRRDVFIDQSVLLAKSLTVFF
jgi:3-phenylpropionate/cinnamic acid dioxygenase small subunit